MALKCLIRRSTAVSLLELPALIAGNTLWSTAIYVEDVDFRPDRPLQQPSIVLNTKLLSRPLAHVHTRADPFLFVSAGEIFLFVEAQRTGAPGHIEAYKSSDLVSWSQLGEILKEPHHLSYPFVFAENGQAYMIPESGAAGEVSLYRFDDFPFTPRKVRQLLQGEFYDSSPVKVGDSWYVFATSPRGLELFFTDDLIGGALQRHPCSPITNDVRYRRCGGAPVRCGGELFRFAQDCSVRYGGNLNLLRIEELSPEAYTESIVTEGLFDKRHSWQSRGGHHMSMASFAGRTVVAVDGQQRDHSIHKFRKLAAVMAGRLRPRFGLDG